MSYENAPATKLLATHCAACSRPLVDAVSVEMGMGPDCRKKYMKSETATPEARERCNALVYQIALFASGMAAEGFDFATAITEIQSLGFAKLADKLVSGSCSVVIEVEGDNLIVRSAFVESALAAWRSVPGRRWVGEKRANVVPASSKPALWALLKSHYAGKLGCGPKGVFKI